jgi:hypothetical protein
LRENAYPIGESAFLGRTALRLNQGRRIQAARS